MKGTTKKDIVLRVYVFILNEGLMKLISENYLVKLGFVHWHNEIGLRIAT